MEEIRELGIGYEPRGKVKELIHQTFTRWNLAAEGRPELLPYLQFLMPAVREFYQDQHIRSWLTCSSLLVLQRSKGGSLALLDKHSVASAHQLAAALQLELILQGQSETVTLVAEQGKGLPEAITIARPTQCLGVKWPLVVDLTRVSSERLIPLLADAQAIYLSDGRILPETMPVMQFDMDHPVSLIEEETLPLDEIRASLANQLKAMNVTETIHEFNGRIKDKCCAAIDSGVIMQVGFDYGTGCFRVWERQVSQAESARRLGMLTDPRCNILYRNYSRVELASRESSDNPLEHEDISLVVLFLLHHKLDMKPSWLFTERVAERFRQCREYLEEVGFVDREGRVLREEVLGYEFSALGSWLILQSLRTDEEMAAKVSLLYSYLLTPGKLHNFEKASPIFRSLNYWSRTGELTSLFHIFGKYLEVQSREVQHEPEEQQLDMDEDSLAFLFEAPLKLRRRESMANENLDTFCTEYYVNKDKAGQILRRYALIKAEFGLSAVPFPDTEGCEDLLEEYLVLHRPALAYFSSNRSKGYLFHRSGAAINYSPSCILKVLGERPFLLLVLRVDASGIESVAKVDQPQLAALPEDYRQKTGVLKLKQQSFHQAEAEFHGLSGAVFSFLERDNHKLVQEFEEDLDVEVELNHQTEAAVISCSGTQLEKVKQKFTELLDWIYGQIQTERKEVTYFEGCRLVIGEGGALQDILMKGESNQLVVDNIHPELEEADLWDYFGEFPVQRIQLQGETARITLQNKADLQPFISRYNYKPLQGNTLTFRQGG